jgi:hypothetical protein
VDIIVTSVLQTTAGRMIFGRYVDAAGGPGAAMPESAAKAPDRSDDSGRRPRPAAQA